MQLISKVEEIKKGIVTLTGDYANTRKVIGISTSNITPNAEGVSPLGNQNSFEIEEVKKEEIGAIDALSAFNNSIETMDFDVPSIENSNVQKEELNSSKFIIPESVVSDVAVGDSVSVASLDTLQNIVNPLDSLEQNAVVPDSTQKENQNSIPDVTSEIPQIELPPMEEVVATEPTNTADDLFVQPDLSILTPNEPKIEEKDNQNVEEKVLPPLVSNVVENVTTMLPEKEVLLEDDKELNAMIEKISLYVKDCIKEYLEKMNSNNLNKDKSMTL